MNRKLKMLSACVVLAGICVVLSGHTPTFAHFVASSTARKCPLVVPVGNDIRVEIVDVNYSTEIDGLGGRRMRIPRKHLKKFRLATVTLKITKPSGRRLRLAAADLTLHYYHGGQTEVAPCEALSFFSASNDSDRPMQMPPGPGPGFVKQTTGARSTRATVVYCDAVFGYMEPDSREMWICVGQPTTVQPFVSSGW